MLLYTEAYKNSLIVRTRDDDAFPKLDIVCDVGGVYDHDAKRYDHHMATFKESWTNDESKDITKLSSAGLIWRHYGEEVIVNICQQWGRTFTEAQIKNVKQRMYDKLILEIDCIDNGISEAAEEHLRYYTSTHLASRVGRMNSSWNSKKSVNQHVQFKKAMKIAEEELLWALRSIVLIHLPAYEIVKEAWDARKDFHPSGEIMFMDRWCPWKDFTFDIEEEEGLQGELKFMVSEDQRKMWKV